MAETAAHHRDWNAEFQAACDLHGNTFRARLDRSLALHAISVEFAAAAKATVIALVDDLLLPPAQRRFSPVNIGGVAGLCQ